MVIKTEAYGQATVPESERKWCTVGFHEGFKSREEALSFARRVAEPAPYLSSGRKFKAVIYTLEVSEVDHVSQEDLLDVGETSIILKAAK